MKKKIRADKRTKPLARLLLILIITSISAVYGVNLYMNELENEVLGKADLIAVVTAATDLEQGHKLQNTDLSIQEFPRGVVLAGNYSPERRNEIVGQTIMQDLQKGEQITDFKILDTGSDTASIGKRWFLLSNSLGKSNIPLQAGDRVDVICVLPKESGGRESVVILQNILVAKIVANDDQSLYGVSSEEVGTILELSLEEGQKLALAQELGSIELVKRGRNDLAILPVTRTDENEIRDKGDIVSPIKYRRFELISGVESESIYLPDQFRRTGR